MDFSCDEELLSLLQREPARAFPLIYDRYSGPLFRFVYRFTANQERAEELLHDIFIELLNGKFAIHGEANLKSWLFTVAKNKSLNFLKKSSAEAKILKITEAVQYPELEMVINDNVKWLSKVEKNLPKDLQQTWALKKQGLDHRQIATQLSIPVGTVKSRFNRLITYLKEELKNES